jgi:hypothetical protein
MIWTEGRFSWPAVGAVVYATLVLVATDISWRLVQAPATWIMGGGALIMATGSAAILLVGSRRKA